MSDLTTDIGNRLRDYRKMLDMTQQDVADVLKISLNFYGSIERGESRLSVEKLYILHNELNADLTYLIAGHYHRHNGVDSVFADCPKDKIADIEQLMLLVRKLYR